MRIPRLSATDPGSYSNPLEAVVTHMDVHFNINFQERIFLGRVNLSVLVKVKLCNELILDTRDLTILKIVDEVDQSELPYTIADPVHTFGSKLTIKLPKLTSEKINIRIDYKTSPQSTALQWLSPEQTAGGKHSYVFSQCQADHCRSIIPCQDSSGVKGTYKATVDVPENLTVVMSAVRDKEPILREHKLRTFSFEQTIPIPAYLIAIAAGNLESKRIGPRSSVWAEPEIIDQAVYEFSDTEKFLKIAEEICGPYVWKIYDILVLPPSFPYGGMENPCLTFITPTILAGDRSLVTVVAHEISHSWTGNLVSVKNFEHFWLNEGFTTFVERKIVGRLKGDLYRQFTAIGGLKDLKQEIETLGETNPLTNLVVDLSGVDPDDAFSKCPYEKGHSFLFYLEELVGGPPAFEAFLRSYFDHFKYTSVDTEDFKNYFTTYFKDSEYSQKVDWDAWLYTPGMPYIIPKYDTKYSTICSQLADKWCKWDESEICPFASNDLKPLEPAQIEEFTATLLENCPFSVSKLKTMNAIYGMDSIMNYEIKFRWLRICVQSRWEDQIENALTFATKQGRMKYVRPIFRDLFCWDKTRDKAAAVFKKNRSKMMHVLVQNLENDFRNTADKIAN